MHGLFSCIVHAETYRCSKNGQTVFSDLPCAAGVAPIDNNSDRTTREQRQQAEIVRSRNNRQLSELEYRAAEARAYRGGVTILPDAQGHSTNSYLPRRR